MKRIIFNIGAIAIIAFAFLAVVAHAGTGVENIALSRYNVSSQPGGNITVNYTLSLVSGYINYGTNLYIVNSIQLGSQNLTVLLSNNFGNPPLSGVLHVFLPHTYSSPGVYNITLAGNSSGIVVNPATLKITIQSPSTTTLSTLSTTISSLQTTISQSTTVLATTIPSTIAYQSYGGSYSYIAIIVILILIIVVLVIMLARKGQHGEKHKKKA